MSRSVLRIATRGSNLALWQANFIAGLLRSLDPDREVELIHVTTTGDRLGDASLSGLGGVGVFTREIQHALLDRRADVAVHSLKDLPTEPVDGICLAAVPKRASPWDALVLPRGSSFPAAGIRDLPPRAGSAREACAAVLNYFSCGPIFSFSTFAATSRPGSANSTRAHATRSSWPRPASNGWGFRHASRRDWPLQSFFRQWAREPWDWNAAPMTQRSRPIVERLSHPATWSAVAAERRILGRLGAGCHAPVGVSTTIEGDELALEAVVLSRDGQRRLHSKTIGPAADPLAIGDQVAEDLLRQGAGPLIEAAATAP